MQVTKCRKRLASSPIRSTATQANASPLENLSSSKAHINDWRTASDHLCEDREVFKGLCQELAMCDHFSRVDEDLWGQSAAFSYSRLQLAKRFVSAKFDTHCFNE